MTQKEDTHTHSITRNTTLELLLNVILSPMYRPALSPPSCPIRQKGYVSKVKKKKKDRPPSSAEKVFDKLSRKVSVGRCRQTIKETLG